MIPVTMEKIAGIASTFKNKYSAGVDDVPDVIFKKVLHSITEPLTFLVMILLTCDYFPVYLNVLKLNHCIKKMIPMI